MDAEQTSRPPTPTPDVTSADARVSPRLPAWARVLLTMAAMLLASFSAALPTLIPGVNAALESEDLVVAISARALVWGTPLAIFLLLGWALVRGVDRRGFRSLGLRLDARAVLALLAGILVSLVVLLLAGGIGQLFALGRAPEMEGAPDEEALPLWFLLTFLLLRSFVLQGIGEEVLFRGYLVASLARRPVAAVLVSAASFAVLHLVSGGGQQDAFERVLYLVMPFGFALSAGFLALKLRTVWAAVGIHGGFHVANAIGQSFGIAADGPAIWLLLGALHAVAGLLIAWRIPSQRWAQIAERGPYAQ